MKKHRRKAQKKPRGLVRTPSPQQPAPRSAEAVAHLPANDELAPWHITSMGCLVASAVLVVLMFVAFFVDVPLANWIRHDQKPIKGDLLRLIMLGEVFGYGLSVVMIIITAGVLDVRGWRVAPRLLLGGLGSGIFSDCCKIFVARWRPNTEFRPEGFRDSFVGWLPLIWRSDLPGEWNRGLQSFPSGHSATAVGLALALSILYPRGTWWFLVLAALAMFQRVVSSAHYLSDTLAGAAVACLFTALLLHWHWLERWLRRIELLPQSP
ncbi:PAP2 superfamily protein [Anatilimnocola aggregata]|uniref:PAP2 superfamily protein n=1 Tax=Anatilimnocola aggregata TaxID=2528021 RepID=A0A517YIJ6_9BACT|nr:phosphatase PAP2 family protein [Anatilimnocola aggregata]QDU30031.1 PAP2 superfamily protein [Anatilimnocola aggregata]